MISSCSAWIVATMSRIPSPRGALTAASSAASLAPPSLRTVGPAEDLVGEVDDLPAAGVELAAAAHVLRVGGGGDVERRAAGARQSISSGSYSFSLSKMPIRPT